MRKKRKILSRTRDVEMETGATKPTLLFESCLFVDLVHAYLMFRLCIHIIIDIYFMVGKRIVFFSFLIFAVAHKHTKWLFFNVE